MKADGFEADVILAHFQLPQPFGAQAFRRAPRANALMKQFGMRALDILPVAVTLRVGAITASSAHVFSASHIAPVTMTIKAHRDTLIILVIETVSRNQNEYYA